MALHDKNVVAIKQHKIMLSITLQADSIWT